MKHLKRFNELKSFVYQNAARNLRKLGHTKRADELDKHAVDMMVKDADSEFNIGECTLTGGIKGKFAGFDFGCSHDMFLNGENLITIPIFFQIPGKINEGNNNLFNVFNIEYLNGKVEISSWNEDDLYDIFNQPMLLLNNRKDANKLFMALKGINTDDEFGGFTKRMSDDKCEEFKSLYSEMITKLSPNLLWRED